MECILCFGIFVFNQYKLRKSNVKLIRTPICRLQIVSATYVDCTLHNLLFNIYIYFTLIYIVNSRWYFYSKFSEIKIRLHDKFLHETSQLV